MADLVENLDRYGTLDSCVVSDAIDALHGRQEGFAATLTGIAPLWQGARALGWAVTMRMEENAAPPGSVHLGVSAIEAARPRNVVVVDNAGRLEGGSWGGLLSTAAAMRNVAGVISNGAIRDIDEARDLRFPVFGSGATCQTARGRYHEVSCGEPVRYGAVEISTGDLMVADASGVVTVARARAHDVLEKALELATREAAMRQALLAGRKAAAVLGGDYEDMLTTPDLRPNAEVRS